MKRIISILFFLICLSLPLNAKIITGEVEYNADLAREEAFSYPISPANIATYRQHLIDSNNTENLNYLFQGITELKDRKIGKFSDGSYGVQYYDDPMYSWYYNASGRLINFTQKTSEGFPCKTTKYKPDGSIANIGLKVSKTESFIYSVDGKLIAHWQGNLCFDEAGNVIMTRKMVE